MRVIYSYFVGNKLVPVLAEASDELVVKGCCLGREITYINENQKQVKTFTMGNFIDKNNINEEILKLESQISFLKSNVDWIKDYD